MKKDDMDFDVRVRPRQTKKISLSIPIEVVDSLKKVSTHKDMSLDALMKFYIGQGLRNDIAHLYTEQMLERTEQVLSRHIESREEVSTILHEIAVGSIGQSTELV